MNDETEQADGWQVRAETAEAALLRSQGEAEARLVRAELKVEALRAGMRPPPTRRGPSRPGPATPMNLAGTSG